MKVFSIPKRIYIASTGYSYTHLGRLFLRLFVGLMMMQFGVRQIMHFTDYSAGFPAVLGMDSDTSLIVMIVLEILCSFCIMCGFLTRLMIMPLFAAMILAEYHILHDVTMVLPYELNWEQPGYLPIMFLGIYMFLLLVGPGKISVDYFLSLHFLHSGDHSEEELEEV